MKKSLIIIAIICIISAVQTSVAQNPITTLQHNGTTQVFYGQGSFVDALGVSVNGDTLNLSTGFFTAPSSITKGVNIIGAGHFPDSANVARRTTIMAGLTINAGADSLRLEGLNINGDIYYGPSSINYVKVMRCCLGNVSFYSTSILVSKNNCSYEECFILGSINLSGHGDNLLIKHCIINVGINSINGGAMIDGNIFLANAPGANGNIIISSQLINNIFLSSLYPITNLSGCVCYNNIYIANSVDFSGNMSGNNYFGINQSSIFVNQSGNTIDYTQNYHLQNPSMYLGTDGTQIGIYGGDSFKEKGAPSNPQITSKSIGTKTDVNGNLQINISAKAQDK